MDNQEVELAKLSKEELEEIKQVEDKLAAKLGRNVALVAFESVEDYVPAELSEEKLKKVKNLEEELAADEDTKMALVAFELQRS
ncbi:hypothetical protein [Fuchsiella alkaliacetigena]|uniref:hypothetical protein n=1 Tax=Fuchsiella alkaliacetigena TaxID=957042 RepID=UPI002009F720|nr:hypothetical protein [Fuchsiella alkaliacetigena]MCK8824633.1 hypothetical protein [Fuchsiella alkaliacetigena]